MEYTTGVAYTSQVSDREKVTGAIDHNNYNSWRDTSDTMIHFYLYPNPNPDLFYLDQILHLVVKRS